MSQGSAERIGTRVGPVAFSTALSTSPICACPIAATATNAAIAKTLIVAAKTAPDPHELLPFLGSGTFHRLARSKDSESRPMELFKDRLKDRTLDVLDWVDYRPDPHW